MIVNLHLRNAAATALLPCVIFLCSAAPSQASTGGQDHSRHEAASAGDSRKSGFEYMGAATRLMQSDDSQNPAMLWVKDGETLWRRPAGPAQRSCSDCHANPEQSMRGVAAAYPAWNEQLARPVNLAHRINLCRQTHQQLEASDARNDELLGLEALIALQSRNLPVKAVTDQRLAQALQRGQRLYSTKIGQMAMSCAQCHDDHAGQRLGGSTIPQGHPTAYPLYRLQWQELGSLTRRLQACLSGVRARQLPAFDESLTELELFLRHRAAGMVFEGPGVRP